MRVSVILPVRNGANQIGEAVKSVLAQNGTVPIELVVVDDASTDGSAAVARAADPHALILTTPGVRPAGARNAGLAVATGDVISFIDHDDLWPEHKLGCQLAALLDPAVDVVIGETLVEWRPGSEVPIQNVHASGVRKTLFNMGSYLVRRHALERLGGFDATLRFGEDVDLMFRMEEAGLTVRYLPVLSLIYRVHGRNMTCGRDAGELGIMDVLRRRLRRQRVGAGTRRPFPVPP